MTENAIKIFENEEFGQIRIIEKDGEPWLVGKDVAEILGYTNTPKAIRDHIDDEDKLTERIVLSGQNREAILINESGLYSLVLSSKLPTAKKFKRWVTSEILPKSRKIVNSLENIEFNGSIDGIVYSRVGVPTTTSRNIANVFQKIIEIFYDLLTINGIVVIGLRNSAQTTLKKLFTMIHKANPNVNMNSMNLDSLI